ncbi:MULTISPECIES: hypothetical protein [unclassified Exiguobacterium]|uniref:hypothetical protein n=1 Tax=unclassified Exiguobacterium TaxID=2644629 RepID=UPI001BEA5963|nr:MULTISPECIES: hypothetical protein [unclassified Exiguobacterium]
MKVKRVFQRVRKEDGFLSIEAVMSMAIVLMVILFGIGMFTYMIPRQAIEEEVHLLGRTAKMQGGLTVEDVEGFKQNMKKRGMVKDENLDDVTVTINLERTSGEAFPGYEDRRNMVGVVIPRGFGKEQAGEYAVMKLKVEVPANKMGISGVVSFFGINDDLPDKYVLSERIMSEHYGGTP